MSNFTGSYNKACMKRIKSTFK